MFVIKYNPVLGSNYLVVPSGRGSGKSRTELRKVMEMLNNDEVKLLDSTTYFSNCEGCKYRLVSKSYNCHSNCLSYRIGRIAREKELKQNAIESFKGAIKKEARNQSIQRTGYKMRGYKQ